MSDASPPEVRPVSLKGLVAIMLGTFLVVLVLLEALDPRWVGAFRTPVAPSRPVAATPAVLGSSPVLQARRRAGGPQIAGPGGARPRRLGGGPGRRGRD